MPTSAHCAHTDTRFLALPQVLDKLTASFPPRLEPVLASLQTLAAGVLPTTATHWNRAQVSPLVVQPPRCSSLVLTMLAPPTPPQQARASALLEAMASQKGDPSSEVGEQCARLAGAFLQCATHLASSPSVCSPWLQLAVRALTCAIQRRCCRAFQHVCKVSRACRGVDSMLTRATAPCTQLDSIAEAVTMAAREAVVLADVASHVCVLGLLPSIGGDEARHRALAMYLSHPKCCASVDDAVTELCLQQGSGVMLQTLCQGCFALVQQPVSVAGRELEHTQAQAMLAATFAAQPQLRAWLLQRIIDFPTATTTASATGTSTAAACLLSIQRAAPRDFDATIFEGAERLWYECVPSLC